jgi:hypothetical protein
MITRAPRREMIGHHGASIVADMTAYVRTLEATASNNAAASDVRLIQRIAFPSPRRGE